MSKIIRIDKEIRLCHPSIKSCYKKRRVKCNHYHISIIPTMDLRSTPNEPLVVLTTLEK